MSVFEASSTGASWPSEAEHVFATDGGYGSGNR